MKRIRLLSIMLMLSGLILAFCPDAEAGFEGGQNTFYGTGAGAATTGDNDYATFIGVNAGNANTGIYNTFIGYGAGYSNTTGPHNTFLGYSSGYLNTTGNWNTFLGLQSGRYNTTGNYNTFVGANAGLYNTTGFSNIYIGLDAGISNTTGNSNIFLGRGAGYWNSSGSGNVFLGFNAGYNETGSNKLYIQNSNIAMPLIYGEFDNRNLVINGNLEVIGPDQGLVYLSDNTTNNTTKVSRMVLNHYVNAEEPLYLFGAASTATNNFVAFGGGNTIGNAATQIDLFTASNTTTPVGYPRLTIIGNGYVGIGRQNPLYPLDMASGAYVTTGGVWTNASSREYKDNIEVLRSDEALDTLKVLNPVKFAYKNDMTEKHVGFIAEEVPELIAAKNRKGLSPMDIVAVLTKVVQEQQKTVQDQQKIIQEQQKTAQEHRDAISLLKEELNELKGKVK